MVNQQADVEGGGLFGLQVRIALGVDALEGAGGADELQRIGRVRGDGLVQGGAAEGGAHGSAHADAGQRLPADGQLGIDAGAGGAAVVLEANG